MSYAVPAEEIVEHCQKLYFQDHLALKTITAVDARKESIGFKVLYVFGIPKENVFLIPFVIVKDNGQEEFPSLAPYIQEAAIYERKIKTFFGLNPLGHPDIRPLLLHENWPTDKFPLRKDFAWDTRPEDAIDNTYEFQKVEGEGIYEIPVGPVHAGIIEPGHFRFSMAGEEIVLLEAKLGFVHKGTEKLFEVLPMAEKVKLSERVSGDTSFTHSLALCQAMESLLEIQVPKRAKYLRLIFSELERLANHFNDLGFMMLDTGYSFGGSNGARLREMIMQWNERLTDSRFLRGVNIIGGVTKDISLSTRDELNTALSTIHQDFSEIIAIAEESSSLLNRLDTTGRLDRQIAIDYGVVGVPARALGIAQDARLDYPYAAYDTVPCPLSLAIKGDVRARFSVRVKEVHASFALLEQALNNLSALDANFSVQTDLTALPRNAIAIGIAEGWRGDIVYTVITDNSANITRVDVRDPSFLNWNVLGYAGKDNIVPDFPLINKSFNLSYSGNDL
ncbi:MAG: hypothetical protein A2458_04500 [Candidatus Kerfeldbacteria bacterium RIFOXYC2_FULL_38_9]|uniref:NADH-quinone oxidoreductase subunit D domain-containing protein n=1 Tax=Candidatus Kerfeldbacteria bacterium RIFOXYB2_FULL_38_14 TaxID=1798547 RepID=A0A1G2BFW0_9BACT|nr:MAG: hypothetical protein A2319_02515 [Candidatus Kerfeldbacteria bacterium RIFOXYB2_FULL_38_14]OGY90364.1 MAG: hypothetical protein A2458_04500 [Candidatus Kerfeldbacteria bacterium RIFOXYC2_FULL_38_9]